MYSLDKIMRSTGITSTEHQQNSLNSKLTLDLNCKKTGCQLQWSTTLL